MKIILEFIDDKHIKVTYGDDDAPELSDALRASVCLIGGVLNKISDLNERDSVVVSIKNQIDHMNDYLKSGKAYILDMQ